MRLVSLSLAIAAFVRPACAFSSTKIQPMVSLRMGTSTVQSNHRQYPKVSSHVTSLSMAKASSEEDAKCPVTIFSNRVTDVLSWLDKNVIKRVIRLVNHAPALLSLSYFGLISMASMMGSGPMANPTTTTAAKATLASVLTTSVGPTTNTAFASLFPTLITPASFVFLVWPIIAVLQLLTVTISALDPSDEVFLTQSDLSSVTAANLFSSAWLLISSNAAPGSLPLGSALILPLVPIFSGYPLRNKPQYVLWAYQLFSSFTTLASFLAFTVELQHGGRIPLVGKVSAEIAASVFLLLYSTASLGVKEKSLVKRVVNFGALSGIVYKRVMGTMAAGATTFLGGVGSLLMSVSFLGTVGCWAWSAYELFSKSTS